MSSLIYHIEEKQVLIGVDTLATDKDGEPRLFTSKAFYLPHLRLLICGTGLGGFLGEWFVRLNNYMVCDGIDNLNYHAPSALWELWNEHLGKLTDPYNGTTTVYHFGFSENTNKIAAYIYRSGNDFNSERKNEYGIGVKPECFIKPNYELPNDIINMMKEQRKIQLSKPVDERVYIGGEMIIYHLIQTGCAIYSLGKFDDYEENRQSILDNLTKSSSI